MSNIKILQIFILLLFTTTSFAQVGLNGPWMKKLEKKRFHSGEFTLEEQSREFEKYWEHHDKDKKGSGYKPFKRWEYFWHYNLNPDGSLVSPKDLWKTWEEKKALENNRAVETVESNWQSVGPFAHTITSSWSSGQGRVNIVTVDPNNPNIYYVGAPSGGLWKSIDAGTTWTPLTDYLPRIGVSGIAIDPNNSDRIFIATGDDDGGDTYSIGVMKSEDGGDTWEVTGLEFTGEYEKANEIFFNPDDSEMLWVATSEGLYKTIDGGETWNNKLPGYIDDLKLNPADPSILYLIKGNTFYRSANFGDNFSSVYDGIASNLGRMAIAVTPANADIVYILGSDGGFEGLYKSVDSGVSFTKTLENSDIFDGSYQSYYDMAIAVSDTDENTIFVGVLNIWKSTDGGDDFTKLNQWSEPQTLSYTHADIHYLRFYNGSLFAGTDGGIYKSDDNGDVFTDLTEGIAIGQFYKISVGVDSRKMVGGLQDNGGYVLDTNEWKNYIGADGMDCIAHPFEPNTFYGFIQNGGTLYVTTNSGASYDSSVDSPTEDGGNWVTPLAISGFGEIFAGYDKLYYLQGNQFYPVSDITFGGNIDHIEIDPSNDDNIYVAWNYNLFKSTDYGQTFSVVNFDFQNTISSIEVNNNNGDIIYVTTAGSNGNVFKSEDAGDSWTDITGNLPSDSKYVLKHQANHPFNPLYLGTSLGVYYTDDTLDDWQVFSTNLPNVPVTDLEINPLDSTITAGTYGRGIWQSEIPIVIIPYDINFSSFVSPRSNVLCGTVIPEIEVENFGQNTITSVEVKYKYDDNDLNTFQWTGQILSNETEEIQLPEGISEIGQHHIYVEVIIENDEFANNNSKSYDFYINSGLNSTQLFDFEDSDDNSFVSIELGQGEPFYIGDPTGTYLNSVYSGTKAYINMDEESSKYKSNSDSRLYTKCYDLTGFSNPEMEFYMAFKTETNADVLYMEYSIDGGNNWTILGTTDDDNWYNNSNDSYPNSVGGQWSGNKKDFRKYSHSLSFLSAANNVLFRYLFKSNQSIQTEGIVIDDFVIKEGIVSNININTEAVDLYPNPANEFLLASLLDGGKKRNCHLEVFNIVGQEVYSNDIEIEKEVTIPVKSLGEGVYTLKMMFEDGNIYNGKFVVRH